MNILLRLSYPKPSQKELTEDNLWFRANGEVEAIAQLALNSNKLVVVEVDSGFFCHDSYTSSI